MAETAKGFGRILSGDQFDFTLDGLASAAQMERLINAIGKSMGSSGAGGTSGIKDTIRKNTELNKRLNESTTDAIKATDELTKSKEDEKKKLKKLKEEADKFGSALRSVSRGKFSGALEILDTGPTKIALGIGAIVGSLTGYADKITEGLQRGISGGIFDYAIAAKTAGVNIEQFSKAITATDGGFASLASGATNGAKEFGLLVGSVREATAGVGNLGMTNEQLAMFTAQQTKTAISQGFKGKAAQEVVIKNSRALGDELDTLANRTGKSVMELAAAAMKLAQDPIVANFVQTAKRGGDQVSKAVQQFGASLRGVFGEAGDAVAADALKSALGNLPFVITQTGKNMISASSAVYSEIERQAKIVKQGGEITAADQEKLRNTIIKEVEARGTELRMLANLEGQAGDSARQLLSLAEQANFYNSAEGAKRREEDKTAQQFNAQVRSFQANLAALSIPFLKLINSVNWAAFIAPISALVDVIGAMLSPLEWLGKMLGASNMAGTVVGGFFGLVAVAGLLFAAQSMYTSAVKNSTLALVGFAKYMQQQFPGSGAGVISAGKKIAGKSPTIKSGIASAALTGVGSAVAGQLAGPADSTSGSTGNLVGSLLGGAIGAFFGGPAGAMFGSTVGGMLGQKAGESIGKTSTDLATVGSENVGSSSRTASAMLSEQQRTNQLLAQQNNETIYGNMQGAKQTALLNDSVRLQRTGQYDRT